MSEEIDILKNVCRRLADADLPYMLTGSLAANFYAVPRMTRDIDIVIEILEINVSEFAFLFKNDFYFNENSILDAIKNQNMFNVIHNQTIIKIDFVVRKNSPYRTIEFQRRRQVNIDGTPIWIVAPEDLIISKLLWAQEGMSDYQLRDVKNLLTSTKLDTEYLDNWVQQLKLTDIYAKVNVYG